MSIEIAALIISVLSIVISGWTAFAATSTLKANFLSLITSLQYQLDDRVFKLKQRLEYVKEYAPERVEKQQNSIERLESSKETLNSIYNLAEKTWWPAFLIERRRHKIESAIQSLDSTEWHEDEIDKALEELVEKTKELEKLKKENT